MFQQSWDHNTGLFAGISVKYITANAQVPFLLLFGKRP